jgi:hypothetical protein
MCQQVRRESSNKKEILRNSSLLRFVERSSQGDQIGPTFASWAVVNFGQFLITKCIPNVGLLFSKEKNCVLILTKSGLGYILGDFFSTNSSGHPGSSRTPFAFDCFCLGNVFFCRQLSEAR